MKIMTKVLVGLNSTLMNSHCQRLGMKALKGKPKTS